MKRIFIGFLAVLLTVPVLCQGFDRDQAIRKAIYEIIVPPTLERPVTAYITKELLIEGDTIRSFESDFKRRVS